MNDKEILKWLLEGDVSIQYQCYRDLLGIDKLDLQAKIAVDGWGKELLSRREKNGHWGGGFYKAKWISSHYTLLELKHLAISPNIPEIAETIQIIFKNERASDGGVNPVGSVKYSDVCINGMVLNYACYFKTEEQLLKPVVDFLLSQKMKDGGFNCHSNRKGATHSSFHTTLSVLEGIMEYEKNGYKYRINELFEAKKSSQNLLFEHNLFRSDKTNTIIKTSFLKFPYPARWYYDILKAMDYFQMSDTKHVKGMNEALDLIINRRNTDGLWKLSAPYPGRVHFTMEQAGKSSRWNTLRALRVLHFYGKLKNNFSSSML